MGFGPGEQVGDYQIIQVLGAGGMGKVYLVRNAITDRVEALKVLLPDLTSDAELADRFSREVRMLASLSHPNIAALHTAVKVDNQLLMVMEYVEGETVQKLASQGALPVGKALDYADQALGALGYAHSRNIIHRDIKPANLMVTPAGVVKLMDFGIARPTTESRLTQTGRTVGSLAYMSPEQINGQVLDCRADIYAFGISLYEMVTGTLPFKGTSDFSIMAGHLNQQPVPPIEIDPKLPPMLSDIILMAIAKDRDQRFQTAEAMRGALRNISHSVTEVMLPGTVPQAQPGAGLPPRPPVAAAATAAASGVAGFPAAPPPAAQQGSSHRGLYLALGSLVTVLVVGLAAVQLPKYFKAGAVSTIQEKKPSAAEIAAGTKVASTPPGGTPTPVKPAETPVQQMGSMTPGSVPDPATNPNGTPKEAPPSRPAPVPVQIAQNREAPKPQGQPQQQVQQRQQAAPPQQTPAAVPNGAPAAVPAPTVTPEADKLEEVREDYIKLASREKAAASSLAHMEQGMAASGNGLRGDIVSARERMGFYLNDAEAALKSGNAAAATRAMEKADREVSKIEAFLGRP